MLELSSLENRVQEYLANKDNRPGAGRVLTEAEKTQIRARAADGQGRE